MANQEDIERQLRFLQIDGSTASRLRGLEELFESSIDDILQDFYAHILKEPELAALFVDEGAIERAREAQKRHWLKTLFSMEFGEVQFDQAKRIARAHVGIGLVPSWYLASYCFLLNHFVELFAHRYENDAAGLIRVVQALNKAVFLDINLVIESYLEAKNHVMRGILLRATHFSADVKRLNEELVSTTRDLHEMVDSYSDAEDLLACSKQLSGQVESLTSRVEELQFKNRLYIQESPTEAVGEVPPASLLTRIREKYQRFWDTIV